MHYLALATDYDGTIADDGVVNEPTLAAMERPWHPRLRRVSQTCGITTH